MFNPLGNTSGTSGTSPQPKTSAPAAPKAADAKLAADSFLRTPPTSAQLAGMRAAIAALDALPPQPSGVEAKKAWLAQVRPTYEAADKALSGMRSASFFHKSLPDAEADAAGTKVYQLGDAIRDAEEATGQRAPEAPANPMRPLFGYSKAVSGWMGNNAFTALIGLIAWPVAATIDAADAVTRPLQALAYPVEYGKYKVREARFEEEQAKAKAPAAKP